MIPCQCEGGARSAPPQVLIRRSRSSKAAVVTGVTDTGQAVQHEPQQQDPRPDRDHLGRGGVRGPAHPARRGLAAEEPGHAAAQQAAVQQVQRPPREGQSAQKGHQTHPGEGSVGAGAEHHH